LNRCSSIGGKEEYIQLREDEEEEAEGGEDAGRDGPGPGGMAAAIWWIAGRGGEWGRREELII
jgi:hypothetical protein